MSFSLNEVEAMVRKAARGAGYSWGMADEAGKAARWLCSVGLDGTAALAGVLGRADGAGLGGAGRAGAGLAGLAPVGLRGDWHAAAGALCPLMAGTALADSAGLWEGGAVRMQEVAFPAVLLPFAAAAARRCGGTVSVEAPGLHAVTDGTAVSLDPAPDAMPSRAAQVTVRLGGQLGRALPRQGRADPAEEDWRALGRLAQRTYAPDTRDSRLTGAGAGLSDND